MAPSSCPSPITPVINMEEEKEHSLTPVTMRKIEHSSHHGSPHARDQLRDDEFIIIIPVTISLDFLTPVMITLALLILFFSL